MKQRRRIVLELVGGPGLKSLLSAGIGSFHPADHLVKSVLRYNGAIELKNVKSDFASRNVFIGLLDGVSEQFEPTPILEAYFVNHRFLWRRCHCSMLAHGAVGDFSGCCSG